MKSFIRSVMRKGVELVVGTALTGGVSMIGMEYLNSKQQQHILEHCNHSDSVIMQEFEKLKKEIIELKRSQNAKP